jgi:tRNA uridine 5-carbamoylmethylation protein Kti12
MKCGRGATNEIVLIRGLPGSGKTTIAKNMQGYMHFEADQFLEVDGVYVYDPSKIKYAHNMCVDAAKKALESGLNVVVSNTFVKIWELQRYIDLGYPFRIIEANGKWKNTHSVAVCIINQMARRWEKIPDSIIFAENGRSS